MTMYRKYSFVGIIDIFNYITNPEERGAGINHLANVRREHSFFIPAVSDQFLSKSYERFGAEKIHFNWFKRLLIPLPSLPLLLKLADQGYKKTLQENKNYLAGLNVYRGKITFKGVSDAFNLDYSSPSDLLSN